jgi:hypothetical protein
MNDSVTYPGALLSGGAVGIGVKRVQLDGADAGFVECIEAWIVASEVSPPSARIEVFAHLKPLERDRYRLICIDNEVQVTQTVQLQATEAVVLSGCHIASACLRIFALPRQLRPKHLLAIVHLDDCACRCFEVKLDETSHNPSKINGEVVGLSRSDLKCDRQFRALGTDGILEKYLRYPRYWMIICPVGSVPSR